MKNKKYIKSLFIRVIISIILFLSISIYINYNNQNLLFFKKYFHDPSFNFASFNKVYRSFFGRALPEEKTKPVVNITNLSYTSAEAYHDGVKLKGVNSVLPFKSGVVVFVGEKENYGQTIIIQGMDGIDYWYGNVTDISIKLYDYVASDHIIANAKNNILYLVFMKAEEVLDFEEYI